MGVDTSDFIKKYDLAGVKIVIDYLDIDNLNLLPKI